MQPSTVPRCKYPDQCKREQSCLRQFAKLRLAGEETGNEESASNSSHAGGFQSGVGYKRDGYYIHHGGSIVSSLVSGESGGMSR